MAGRVIAAAAVLGFAALVLPLLPAARVPGAARRVARALLTALGVRHRVSGRLTTRRALVVANHGGVVHRRLYVLRGGAFQFPEIALTRISFPSRENRVERPKASGKERLGPCVVRLTETRRKSFASGWPPP